MSFDVNSIPVFNLNEAPHRTKNIIHVRCGCCGKMWHICENLLPLNGNFICDHCYDKVRKDLIERSCQQNDR